VSISENALLDREATLKRLIGGTLVFLAIAVVGLFIVKWWPYWHKAFVAAATRTIGASIVSGKSVQPQAVGIAAAWSYTLAYFKSVWEAVVLALVLGASIQVLVPRKWLLGLIGGNGYRSTAIAGAASMAGMMCTCCTAPIVVGMRRQRVGIGGAMAFFLGNPVLNPATVVFIGLVLGWPFAIVRIVFGLALVFVVAWLASRVVSRDAAANDPKYVVPLAAIDDPKRTAAGIAASWLKELWVEIYTLLPGYIAIVFVLGGLRAWLFPPGLTIHASGLGAIALLSAIGTLFVIPTAGEIPITQTLLHAGMGVGPATALLMTLPAISAPSLFIVRKVFPPRALIVAVGGIFIVGILAGVGAMLMMHAA
jgi:hypothetical protein